MLLTFCASTIKNALPALRSPGSRGPRTHPARHGWSRMARGLRHLGLPAAHPAGDSDYCERANTLLPPDGGATKPGPQWHNCALFFGRSDLAACNFNHRQQKTHLNTNKRPPEEARRKFSPLPLSPAVQACATSPLCTGPRRGSAIMKRLHAGRKYVFSISDYRPILFRDCIRFTPAITKIPFRRSFFKKNENAPEKKCSMCCWHAS